jgi:hypothetical protein
MRRIFALPVLLTILAGLTACPDHDASLDDALRQYVAQREAETEAGCECYQLFLNLGSIESSIENEVFTSKEECLETLLPVPEDDAVNCMKSVLDSSSYGTEDSVEVVKCYTEVIAKKTDCYAQNAGECSQSACSSGIETVDKCQGNLTDTEAEAFYYCAVR